jgi:hypothetical protein
MTVTYHTAYYNMQSFGTCISYDVFQFTVLLSFLFYQRDPVSDHNKRNNIEE